MHGGATPRGAASVHYQGKGFSRDLPTRLADRFDEILADPDLLSVRGEAALAALRIKELLGKLNTGECADHWERLRELLVDLRAASTAGNMVAFGTALTEMGRLIEAGAADVQLWREISDASASKAMLARSEHVRLRDLAGLVPVEQCMTLVVTLYALVKKHVHDPVAIATIGSEMNLLTRRELVEVVPTRNGDAR